MSASLADTRSFVSDAMAASDRAMRELGPSYGGRPPMGLDANFLTYGFVQDGRGIFLVMRLSVEPDPKRSIDVNRVESYFGGWRWGSRTWAVRKADLTGNFVLTFALSLSGYEVQDIRHWMLTGFTGVMAEEERDPDLAFGLLDEVLGRR